MLKRIIKSINYECLKVLDIRVPSEQHILISASILRHKFEAIGKMDTSVIIHNDDSHLNFWYVNTVIIETKSGILVEAQETKQYGKIRILKIEFRDGLKFDEQKQTEYDDDHCFFDTRSIKIPKSEVTSILLELRGDDEFCNLKVLDLIQKMIDYHVSL